MGILLILTILLISMLSDESYEIRKEAVDRINDIRSSEDEVISL